MSRRSTRRPSRGPLQARKKPPTGSSGVSTYWERTHWPLQCLYFLLPILIAYSLGTLVVDMGNGQQLPPIFAEALLRRFFEMFGVTGFYLPGVFVVVVLLSWHVVQRDPWEPELRLYAGMLVESLLLAAPLLVLAALIARGAQSVPVLAMLDPADMTWSAKLLISIGAGIYEELLFRLIGIAIVHTILVDVLRMPMGYGSLLAVAITSALFAVYHFGPGNPYTMARFALYFVAGAYLASVYLIRGFGICVGVHAAYDVFVFSVDGG